MFEHVIVAWRSGLRSRSFHATFILGLLAMGAAYLAAQFSGRQPATVALDVGLSGIRIIVLLMIVFWCQELVAREIEKRTVFLALAYPVPRSSYLLGRYFGILALTFLAIAVLGITLYISTYFAEKLYGQQQAVNLGWGYFVTLLYIFVDAAVIAAFTILVAAFSTTPLLPLALGLAFAVAARGLGQSLAYLRDPDSGAAGVAPQMNTVFDIVRWVIPDLGQLDIRSATLYNVWPDNAHIFWPLINAIGYSAVVMTIAIMVFRRRQFN
jgi:ABC-type transport system involved in multi-copper enzyme maturation permease subunit